MLLKNNVVEDYERFVENNSQDPYSFAVVTYMNKWAQLMEEEMQAGAVLTKEIVNKLSHDADEEGITGFMYHEACNRLCYFWIYGDELEKLLV